MNSPPVVNEFDPTRPLDLVTGATGMLGSHIVERLLERGRSVRALVRRGSDTTFLKRFGIELREGDLTDPVSCETAVRGMDHVYHAAAKVGDWGRWEEFQSSCVDATRTLGEAAAREKVKRFVHISSTSAYGHPKEGVAPIKESDPMGQNLWVWDSYTRSKVESEKVLWKLAESSDLPLTVIRPSWLFGERDRTTTARLVDNLKREKIRLIGRGENPLSAIYVGEVADAAVLAAHHPGARGEAFNVTSQGPITQREFMNLFAEACEAAPVKRKAPYRAVFAVAFLFEAQGRLTGRVKPPWISRYATWLLGRDLEYSTEKARERLRWTPKLSYRESIERTVRWYLRSVQEQPEVNETYLTRSSNIQKGTDEFP